MYRFGKNEEFGWDPASAGTWRGSQEPKVRWEVPAAAHAHAHTTPTPIGRET